MVEAVVTMAGTADRTQARRQVDVPGDGMTKGEVIRYCHRIANTGLRHYCDRPLTMQRCQDGVDAGGFFQKHRPSTTLPGSTMSVWRSRTALDTHWSTMRLRWSI